MYIHDGVNYGVGDGVKIGDVLYERMHLVNHTFINFGVRIFQYPTGDRIPHRYYFRHPSGDRIFVFKW